MFHAPPWHVIQVRKAKGMVRVEWVSEGTETQGVSYFRKLGQDLEEMAVSALEQEKNNPL